MTLPATIQPRVGQSLITRVTRLYNGSLVDCLAELLQNSRRAGATRVDIETGTLGGWPALIVRDNGSGIDDPAKVLTLGESGWDQDIAHREDPAGMGFFSLAGRHVAIRSFAQSAGSGWEVLIPEDGWQGGVILSVRPHEICEGTEIAIVLPETWVAQLNSAVLDVARFYPLPVSFQGAVVTRQDFLEGAFRIEEWRGCQIGVFKKYGTEPKDTPRINFHGVTVPYHCIEVQELCGNTWSARVDIIDAPALQLVLPARKEMVQNDALAALRIAMEGAIYRSIAAVGEHRLPFSTWQRAAQFGVDLPEAAPWLESWRPSEADNNDWLQGDRIAAEGSIIVPCREADLEQAAAPVIGNLDDAIVLIADGANIELGDLVSAMERSLFCSSDDCECDSWQTQHGYFVSEARNIAAKLLFGEEEALIVALREAVEEHLVWRIPTGRQLAITARAGELSLSLNTFATAE